MGTGTRVKTPWLAVLGEEGAGIVAADTGELGLEVFNAAGRVTGEEVLGSPEGEVALGSPTLGMAVKSGRGEAAHPGIVVTAEGRVTGDDGAGAVYIGMLVGSCAERGDAGEGDVVRAPLKDGRGAMVNGELGTLDIRGRLGKLLGEASVGKADEKAAEGLGTLDAMVGREMGATSPVPLLSDLGEEGPMLVTTSEKDT